MKQENSQKMPFFQKGQYTFSRNFQFPWRFILFHSPPRFLTKMDPLFSDTFCSDFNEVLSGISSKASGLFPIPQVN
ncbi:hypothetical protein XELAEV_18011143mg [Xenopus laevis]|uniref:Uncharacterized protein n=1 Tax=Xenopus laevis TaxID=8355 RepID=A0A974I2M6_XENLA|nr:hypothetical protein XELAEV_18011143mg [Xenopus laevis]